MKIIHRIAFVANDADRRALDSLGVRLRPQGLVPEGFISFDVAESDPNWRAMREWIEQRGLGEHWIRTVYSEREINAAAWLSLESVWHHGYPQPEDAFGYTRTTYDPLEYCAECGIAGRQQAPFVMAGEPKWGTRAILQLNWIFDEFFVTPEVGREVFAPFGIGVRPVLGRRGEALSKAVQLVNEERVSIAIQGLSFALCPSCGRAKYPPLVGGPLPRLATKPLAHLARTSQSFGSGRRAYNLVIASSALVRALREKGVRGVSFVPIAASGE